MVRVLQPGEPLPPPQEADETGLLAAGGSLNPARMLSAYRRGIFPWPLLGDEAPLLWFSPDPRFVLFPSKLHCSKSLRKVVKSGRFEIRINQRFGDVVRACAGVHRRNQDGTWITPTLISGYERLHQLGVAHSVEVHRRQRDARSDDLVGGLYGLCIGRVFFGESMFSRESNASKVGFVHLVHNLVEAGCALVDCQQQTGHLEQFGAQTIPRAEFCELLDLHCPKPLRRPIGSAFASPWTSV